MIMKRIIIALISIIATQSISAQEKELLIIGTMHTVPNIVSHSYRPLLKYAKAYKPEAIFTEDIRPDDTLSMRNFTPRFLNIADSLRKTRTIDERRFQTLKSKQLSEMNTADFEFLADAYLLKRDRANYNYYKYLKNYGTAGPKKPLQNENGDLIAPLAIAMGLTELIPVDDHQTESEYQQAWRQAMKSIQGTGNDAILAKLMKQDSRKRVWPALRGKLGKHTNHQKTLQRFYLINSCRYATHPNESTDAVRELWDARNLRIAKNLTEQIKSKPYQRSILIIGAGHVLSVRDMLKEVYPELKVKLMCDRN